MQIFIDSADPTEIKTAWDWGFVDGVTTNPSLAAKTGLSYTQIVHQILNILDDDSPLSLEVIATDFDTMLRQARALSQIDPRVIVKLPCTLDGLRATKQLFSEGILVNVTLVFTPQQALLAAKAGAYYISPFVGRLDDIEPESGDELVADIIEIFANYDFDTQVLFASVRDVEHVNNAALLGADIVTAPFAVLKELPNHNLTETGLQKFLDDWKESGLTLPS